MRWWEHLGNTTQEHLLSWSLALNLSSSFWILSLEIVRENLEWKGCVWGWLKAAWSCYSVGDKVQNTSIILWHVVRENEAVLSLCTKSPRMRLPPHHTHTQTHRQTDRQTDTHNCKAPHEKYCRPMQLASKIVQVNHRSRYPASCAWSPKMDSSIKGNTDSYICPKPNR